MATTPPAETDILCENCGYMLNGLPDSGNCPECGTLIDLSISDRLRVSPPWENPSGGNFAIRFVLTTAQILFSPARFYRSLNARGPVEPAQKFAKIHCALAAAMLGTSAWFHWLWTESMINPRGGIPRWLTWGLLIAMPIATYIGFRLIVRLAARLTNWEATYRGYRLPHAVVVRALSYHAADYFPVALIGLVTTAGYHFLDRPVIDKYGNYYLYLLSAEVILSAAYLFITYWTAMRNLMYANR
ncbi:MAG: hypothetical protein M3O30_01015 [Planctomycetota bacterium]|nr:hypothetical protein [Planctomycetota bacterium]